MMITEIKGLVLLLGVLSSNVVAISGIKIKNRSW